MRKALHLVLWLVIMLFAPVMWNAASSAQPFFQQLHLGFLALLAYSCFIVGCIIWAFRSVLKDRQI